MNAKQKIFFAVLLFLGLEVVLFLFVDRPLSLAMRQVEAAHPAVTNFFRAYTDMGKAQWYLPPSGLAMIAAALALRFGRLAETMRQKVAILGRKLGFFFACVTVSGIATDLIKPIPGRARPVMLQQENLYGFHPMTFHATWNAMPSGHATTAFALAFALSYLAPRGRILWWFIALALAVSRIVVNAHYLSDVLAGGCVACATFYMLRVVSCQYGIIRTCDSIFPIDRKNPLP